MQEPTKPKQRKQVKVNAMSYGLLVRYMLEGEHTCHELAGLTGLHYLTVLQYARELHAAKAAHICRWEKDSRGRDALKVYKIGRGKDAKRTRMPETERTRNYRARKRSIAMIQMTAGVVT